MEKIKATAEGAIAIQAKNVSAFGTQAAEAPLQTLNIKRRIPALHDVKIEIL